MKSIAMTAMVAPIACVAQRLTAERVSRRTRYAADLRRGRFEPPRPAVWRRLRDTATLLVGAGSNMPRFADARRGSPAGVALIGVRAVREQRVRRSASKPG